jgi:hypothetical protein
MYPRKIALLTIFVNLSMVLVLTCSSGIAFAASHQFSNGGRIKIAQLAQSKTASYAGAPAYDSGWESLSSRPDPVSVEFTHNLGGDPDTYLVRLECRDNTTLSIYNCTNDNFFVQALWYGLNDTSVHVYITGGSQPDGVRLRIYMTTPVYDSGWEILSIRPDPISVEFTHNVGGDPEAYQVSLECRDDTALGTYDCTNDNFNIQAAWYGLTGTTALVYVNGGSQPDGVRLRIYMTTPVYDSGWESLSIRPDPISVEFTHNLGGETDAYQVSLECVDDTALSTYNCTNDNFSVQVLWYDLTNTTVSVFVRGGSQPDGVRLRIWRVVSVYLPIVKRP